MQSQEKPLNTTECDPKTKQMKNGTPLPNLIVLKIPLEGSSFVLKGLTYQAWGLLCLTDAVQPGLESLLQTETSWTVKCIFHRWACPSSRVCGGGI